MVSTAMTPLNAKVKPEEKELFAKICDEIGTTPSNALRMFVAAFNKQGGFPFDTSAASATSSTQKTNSQNQANKESALEAINKICKKFPAIDKAFLFGSLARGTYSSASDIDIRLVLDRSERFNLRDLAQFAKQIEQLTHREVDVITSDHIKNKQLAEAIRKDGIVAYERKE